MDGHEVSASKDSTTAFKTVQPISKYIGVLQVHAQIKQGEKILDLMVLHTSDPNSQLHDTSCNPWILRECPAKHPNYIIPTILAVVHGYRAV